MPLAPCTERGAPSGHVPLRMGVQRGTRGDTQDKRFIQSLFIEVQYDLG